MVVDADDAIWLLLDFVPPWSTEPPSDLFSFFFQASQEYGGAFTDVGWEVHTGERMAFGSRTVRSSPRSTSTRTGASSSPPG